MSFCFCQNVILPLPPLKGGMGAFGQNSAVLINIFGPGEMRATLCVVSGGCSGIDTARALVSAVLVSTICK